MEPDMKNYGFLNFSLMPLADTAVAAHSRACPRCHSAVFNVSRRLNDLFLSIFIPLRRYRCISMKCSWEGTLREKRSRRANPLSVAASQESVRNAAPIPIRQAAAAEKTRVQAAQLFGE